VESTAFCPKYSQIACRYKPVAKPGIAVPEYELIFERLLTFELQTVAAGGGINITDTTSSDNMVVISYGDDDEYVDKLNWSMEWIIGGSVSGGDGDDMLEPGEIVKITVILPGTGATQNDVTLAQATGFILEVKPPQGSVVPILRTTPASLDDVMWLYH